MLDSRVSFAAFASAAVLALSACAGGGYSQAQLAYNACTDSHNEKRHGLEDDWAFVSGVGSSGTSCFWAWGRGSPGEAMQDALANCRETYGECFVFSSSAGLEDWVRQISDNGGSDGSGGGSAFSVGDALSLATAGLQAYGAAGGTIDPGAGAALAGGLSLGAAGLMAYDAANGGGAGGSGGYGTGGEDCYEGMLVHLRQELQMAEQCGVRADLMASIGARSGRIDWGALPMDALSTYCQSGWDPNNQLQAFNSCSLTYLCAAAAHEYALSTIYPGADWNTCIAAANAGLERFPVGQ